MELANPKDQFTVREARVNELPELADVIAKGFTEDPVNNYIGGVKRKIEVSNFSVDFRGLRAFMWWQIYIARNHCGGRVMVVTTRENGRDTIIAGAIWNAPGKRLKGSLMELVPLYRAGTLSIIRHWGVGSIKRTLQYFPKSEEVFHREWQRLNIQTSIDDTWQCWTVVVLPAYRGKGLLSRLFRDFYDFAPGKILVLEATSEAARDQYAHLGFVTLDAVHYGKGICDSAGVVASGDEATGFTVYPMVNWKARGTP